MKDPRRSDHIPGQVPRNGSPRFHRVLVHSSIWEDVQTWLAGQGVQLQRVDDVRDGPAHVMTLTVAGARAIRRNTGGSGQ